MEDSGSFVDIPVSIGDGVMVCSSSRKSICCGTNEEEGWQVMAKYLDFKLRFGETAMPLVPLWHFADGRAFSALIGQQESETSILSIRYWCSHLVSKVHIAFKEHHSPHQDILKNRSGAEDLSRH